MNSTNCSGEPVAHAAPIVERAACTLGVLQARAISAFNLPTMGFGTPLGPITAVQVVIAVLLKTLTGETQCYARAHNIGHLLGTSTPERLKTCSPRTAQRSRISSSSTLSTLRFSMISLPSIYTVSTASPLAE